MSRRKGHRGSRSRVRTTVSDADKKIADEGVKKFRATRNPFRKVLIWNEYSIKGLDVATHMHRFIAREFVALMGGSSTRKGLDKFVAFAELEEKYPILQGLTLQEQADLYDNGLTEQQLFANLCAEHPDHLDGDDG